MPNTGRGYPYPLGSDDAFPPDDFQALAQAVNDDIDAVEGTVSGLDTASEYAFSTWKPVERFRGSFNANNFTLQPVLLAADGTTATAVDTTAVANAFLLPFDTTEFTAGSRTTQLRLVTSIIPNGNAPATDITIALYTPTVNKPSGTGASAYVASLGSWLTGSNKTSATLSTTNAVTVTGDPFTAPASGLLAVAAIAGAGAPATARVEVIARLQYRQV